MESSNSEKNSSIDWKTIIISNGLTFIVTVLASVTIYYYTIEKAQLRYEVFPLSSFISNKNKISIINTKIANNGSKEAEDVVCFFKFKKNVLIKEANIDVSSPGIKYNTLIDTSKNTVRYEFPTLNSSEQCNFSFLLASKIDSLKTSDLEVSLRGKGVNGTLVSANSTAINTFSNVKLPYIITGSILYILLLVVTVRRFIGRYIIVKKKSSVSDIMLSAVEARENIKSFQNVLSKKISEASIPKKANVQPVSTGEDSLANRSSEASRLMNDGVRDCDNGYFDNAILKFNQALSLNPQKSTVHSNLARAYANKGNFPTAFSELNLGEKLLKDGKDLLINTYVSAQVYSLYGRRDKAKEFLVKACEIDPKKVKAKIISDKEFRELRDNGFLNDILGGI